MSKSINDKEQYVKSLKGTISDTELRKKIGEVFKVAKTQRQAIFNRLFGADKKEFKVLGDKAVAESKDNSIRTIEDLVRICSIDLNEWQCVKFTANSYADKFQAKGEFTRKKENLIKKIVEEIKADLLKCSPIVKYSYSKGIENNDLMLEMVLADVHLGRLCWAAADGDDYSLKIARNLVMDAVDDMLNKAGRFGSYSKVVLWIAGDYLNVDNEENTTTGSTPQSVDSRFSKVFKEGKDILIEVISKLKEIAPVDVIITRGNHDYNSLFHLGEVIEAYYHNDKNIKIDNSPAPRKYYKYGKNLIQFSHGDKVDIKKLPEIAAAECKDWSSCIYRELHSAHLHHEKLIVSETAGVKTRVMNVLAGVDNYHATHGYVKNIRCAQSFIWHKENGLQSLIYSNPVK